LRDIAVAQHEIERANADSSSHRAVSARVAALAGVTLILAALAVVAPYRSALDSSVQPSATLTGEPVWLLIADFQNLTGNRRFDKIAEFTVRRGLNAARFTNALDRFNVGASLGVTPPNPFDESAVHQIATKHALQVVVSGLLERQPSAYRVSIKATRSRDGSLIVEDVRNASSEAEVLQTVVRSVANIRSALGDDTSQSDQMREMRGLSSTSLEVLQLTRCRPRGVGDPET
jgi:hypothetical protein